MSSSERELTQQEPTAQHDGDNDGGSDSQHRPGHLGREVGLDGLVGIPEDSNRSPMALAGRHEQVEMVAVRAGGFHVMDGVATIESRTHHGPVDDDVSTSSHGSPSC